MLEDGPTSTLHRRCTSVSFQHGRQCVFLLSSASHRPKQGPDARDMGSVVTIAVACRMSRAARAVAVLVTMATYKRAGGGGGSC